MNEPPYLNPYAAPSADLGVSASSQHSWIEKKSLVVPKDWQSPPICLLTGATTDLTPVRKKALTWVHPGLMVLILLGIIGIIAVLLLQKKGTIHYYLSQEKAAEIRRKLAVNWSIFASGAFLISLLFIMERPIAGLTLFGFLLLLISGILAATVCRSVRPGKITRTHIWLTNIPLSVREQIVAMEQESLNRPWR